jgi:hypothetical protein
MQCLVLLSVMSSKEPAISLFVQLVIQSLSMDLCRQKHWCICAGALHNVKHVQHLQHNLGVSVMELAFVVVAGLEKIVPSHVAVEP